MKDLVSPNNNRWINSQVAFVLSYVIDDDDTTGKVAGYARKIAPGHKKNNAYPFL